ncbi:MAG TPA: PEGA domain-containing protein [Steroidobacteraceae bacterium]|nr:PEGA domain-containing protein [Steroidobacteraceae bacterium]
MKTKTTVVRNAAIMVTTAIGALGLGACATIIHSPRQQVAISSTPAGATISIDNREVGKTPLVTKLARKDEHVLRIELAGYQPFQATLSRRVSGWVWGNIVFGGLVGLAVDAVSGGMYELRPDQVSAALASGQARIERQGDGLYVLTVLEPQPDWMKVAQLQRD